MKLFSTTAAFLMFSTGLSMAAIDTTALVSDLQAQGYTRVEVKNGPTQTKVEAIRGTEKVEVVYDKDTGAVLKSESETVDASDDTTAGVSIRDRDRDFVGAGRPGTSDDDQDGDIDASDDDADDSDDADEDRADSDDGDDNGGGGRGRGRGGDDDGDDD